MHKQRYGIELVCALFCREQNVNQPKVYAETDTKSGSFYKQIYTDDQCMCSALLSRGNDTTVS